MALRLSSRALQVVFPNDYRGGPKYAVKLDDGAVLYQVGYINFEHPKEQSFPGDRKSVITLVACEEAPKTESRRDTVEVLNIQTVGRDEIEHNVCDGIVFADQFIIGRIIHLNIYLY